MLVQDATGAGVQARVKKRLGTGMDTELCPSDMHCYRERDTEYNSLLTEVIVMHNMAHVHGVEVKGMP